MNEKKININDSLTKLFKYIFLGFVVVYIASMLPNNNLDAGELWILGLSAACTYSILDMFSPLISKCSCDGIGLKEGFTIDKLL
jgi:hypothetical protein